MENKPKLTTEKRTVSIDLICENPWNPNSMSEFMFEQMKKTIDQKGLFGSIYVRPYAGMYQILDGEHRFKACKELGYKELPVECTLTEITDQETKFWTIYFNNTKGKDDVEKKASLIQELEAGQQQLLPYTDDELQNIKDLVSFDFSQFDTKGKDMVDEFGHIISFKLSKDEWNVIQIAIAEAITKGKTQKEWFLDMVKSNFIQSGLTTDVVKNALTTI